MKTTYCITLICIYFYCFSIAYTQSIRLPISLQNKIPYDITYLSEAPQFRWADQSDSVWSLYYKGENYKSKPTEIFAYYASPTTFIGSSDTKANYPAIVLVHGGGGTAFPIWVKYWAKKGYAAIAMDLGGARPLPENQQATAWSTKSEPLSNGAPDDIDQFKFYNINENYSEQWQYHAVSGVIRAHSLIRSFANIDTTSIGLTGISWGGYLASIVAGIDHRLSAVAPVYGCGFLHEKSAWLSRFDSLGLTTSIKWINTWDPSVYVAEASMPMLFINGTNDFAYDVESWQKTVDLVSNAQQLLVHKLKHNHEVGALLPEVCQFFKSTLSQHKQLSAFKKPIKISNWITTPTAQFNSIDKAYLIYTMQDHTNKEREWIVKPAYIKDKLLIGETTPDIKLSYFQVVDSLGFRTSTPIAGYLWSTD